MMKAYQYFIEHSDKIGGWVLDHLIISLIAIGIGTLLGIGFITEQFSVIGGQL
ncbi:MAG: hypothetical protein ACOC3W_09595 [Thermodesulfobacteriota bacterium]